MTKTDELKFLVGRNIQRLREELFKKHGKTVTEICASIGMSRAFWADIENGRKEASISTLERIAGVLGVSASDLLSDNLTVFAQSEVPRDKKTKRRKTA